MRGITSICSLVLLWALSTGTAFSQAVSATVLGTVTDASGAVVADAKVTITETNTGVTHTGTANGSGNYTFPNLPPGQYQVTVEAPGFKKEVRNVTDVVSNSTTRIDVQLQPGSVSETVEVTASAAVLKTDRADISATIDKVQLSELP